MLQSSHVHEQLLSLGRLSLEDRPLSFTQAFISLRKEDGTFSWSCTLRGVTLASFDGLEGEVLLHAKALDGRQIEGHALVPASMRPSVDAPQPLELEGVGPLLVDGREL